MIASGTPTNDRSNKTMALYTNVKKLSPLQAVEFAVTPVGNFTFFHVDQPAQMQEMRQWATEKLGQEIFAETVVDGNPVLVTRGTKSQDEILALAKEHGGELKQQASTKKIDPWKLRGMASVVGQSLQITSAVLNVKRDPVTKMPLPRGGVKNIDGPLLTFAVLNMGANVMNWVLGSQKTPDTHHLKYLKQQTNTMLAPHVTDSKALPGIEEDRSHLRKEQAAPLTKGQKLSAYIKSHSVVIGEIGMRYLASLSLVFPMAGMVNGERKFFGGWQNIAKNVSKGDFKTALKNGVNKDSKLIVGAGCAYLFGKFIALFTKVKDPYDPKPHTALDSFRENILFKMGSLIEAGAGATIAINAFRKKKIQVGNEIMPDWAGGIGGIIFATGYLIRLGAKFGEKQLDIKELETHVSDSLAQVKPEDVPQLAADCAAAVQDDLRSKGIGAKNRPIQFGDLYAKIITDFYENNKAALRALKPASKESALAGVGSNLPITPASVSHDGAKNPVSSIQGEKIWSMAERKVAQHPEPMPLGSHVEKTAAGAKSELGLIA